MPSKLELVKCSRLQPRTYHLTKRSTTSIDSTTNNISCQGDLPLHWPEHLKCSAQVWMMITISKDITDSILFQWKPGETSASPARAAVEPCQGWRCRPSSTPAQTSALISFLSKFSILILQFATLASFLSESYILLLQFATSTSSWLLSISTNLILAPSAPPLPSIFLTIKISSALIIPVFNYNNAFWSAKCIEGKKSKELKVSKAFGSSDLSPPDPTCKSRLYAR